MSRSFYIGILCFALSLPIFGQDSLRYSVGYESLLSLTNVWSGTQNPVQFHENPTLEFGRLGLGYSSESGDFKAVMVGGKFDRFQFGTEQYKIRNKVRLFGKFAMNKTFEQDANYSLVNQPYRGTPYIMFDTLDVNETINREFYQLIGGLSIQLNQFKLGALVDYNVGVSAQNRDLRLKSIVNDLCFKPGASYAVGDWKLGANLLLNYYNEENEVSTVKSGTQHAAFYQHGIRTVIFHEAATFKRLYENLEWGGEVQLNYKTHLLQAGFRHGMETANDGRANSEAIWSVIRNFSELDQSKWNVGWVTNFEKGDKIKQVKAHFQNQQYRGTEFEQILERPGEQENYQWRTLVERKSYLKNQLNTGMQVRFAKLYHPNLIKQDVRLGVDYGFFHEQYLPFKDEKQLSSLDYRVHYSRQWLQTHSLWAVDANVYYHQNIDHKLIISENVDGYPTGFPSYYKTVENKIVRPDYEYLASSYLLAGLGVRYEHNLNSIAQKVYISVGGSFQKPDNAQQRSTLEVKLGVLL